MFFIILFLAVAGVLFAVFLYKNDKGGNILVGASPDTTAFQLYYYDGETVMVRTLYDSSTEKEVIKRINDIPLQAAEEQALSQMETPFFGKCGTIILRNCFSPNTMAGIFPLRSRTSVQNAGRAGI